MPAKKSNHSTKTVPIKGGDTAASLFGCIIRATGPGGEVVELDLPSGSAVVGTAEQSDLVLSDPGVSRTHLHCELVEGGMLVTDLESKNGTYYLGTRIQKAVAPLGATLRLGESRLLLASRQPPQGPGHSECTSYGAIVGATPVMRRLFALMERIEGFSDYTVLILGESGVGKEVVAREIHKHSTRANGPFEVVDCTALPATLAESELFGYEKGAFTGAQGRNLGAFRRAHGGTVCLDEIGEMPLDLQPKLLRALQEREVRPIGGDKPFEFDIRVIAATNRNLDAAVKEGRFREDLFFRLKMLTMNVPPLRDRREDIPLLIAAFLKELDLADVSVSPETVELFTTGYDWPGNVRELKNAIASTVALGTVPTLSSTQQTDEPGGQKAVEAGDPFHKAKKQIIHSFEHDYLMAQLRRFDNNISGAARASKMDRSDFKRLLRKHGLLPNRQ